MRCLGIRGAITVEENKSESIIAATGELLQKMVDANDVVIDDIAAVWFTTTTDLDVAFPAVAAREMGWLTTALICGHEMNVPDSLPLCIRVMLLWNTEKKKDEIVHIYLKGAGALRTEFDAGK